MELNKYKIDYINKQAFKIVELIEESQPPKGAPMMKGSSSNKPILDLSNNIEISELLITEGLPGFPVSIRKCFGETCLGFNRENFKEFAKFVKSIHEDKQLQHKVSFDFISRITFEWLINTYKSKIATCDLSNYLLDEVIPAIKNYRIHFPIQHIEIFEQLRIGNVIIGYYTEDFFNETKLEDSNEDAFIRYKTKFKGSVYASFVANAEKEKAVDIAFKECSLAVDILKACSSTSLHPEVRLIFDIDARLNVNSVNEILIFDNDINKMNSIQKSGLSDRYHLDARQWELMKKMKIAAFSEFIGKLEDDRTEIQKLIVNSIARYSNALSTANLNQRVVKIFTILESLLLKNNDSPILDSVRKYCPKLITKDPAKRIELTKLLKKMYDVRSSYIHHAKELDINLDDLKELQICTMNLILMLMVKSQTHDNMLSVLTEVDKAINEAY